MFRSSMILSVLFVLCCSYSHRTVTTAFVVTPLSSSATTTTRVTVSRPTLLLLLAHKTDFKNVPTIDRLGFLQSVATATGALLLAQPASYAADTVDPSAQLAVNAALRNVKSCQKVLEGLAETTIPSSDYTTLKQTLRVAPVSNLRKSCTTIVSAAAEDETKAAALQKSYKTFVRALETLDGTASLALRGKTLKNDELQSAYFVTVQALNDFVAMATASDETTASSSTSSSDAEASLSSSS